MKQPDPKECATKAFPSYVAEMCVACGKRYNTSVRALAEGRDTCVKCRGCTYDTEITQTIRTVSAEYFKSLYRFFEEFWGWINNQSIINELKLIHTTAPVLFYTDKKAASSAEEVSIEETEIRILQTLFEAFLNWKIMKSRRSWKRVYFAFWQAEHFYRG